VCSIIECTATIGQFVAVAHSPVAAAPDPGVLVAVRVAVAV
jgi:hypothetical protein